MEARHRTERSESPSTCDRSELDRGKETGLDGTYDGRLISRTEISGFGDAEEKGVLSSGRGSCTMHGKPSARDMCSLLKSETPIE